MNHVEQLRDIARYRRPRLTGEPIAAIWPSARLTPAPPNRYASVPPDNPGDPDRMTGPETVGRRFGPPVAVIQPLPGIGDMVWHLPHIRAIAAHAGAPVTLLTKPRSLADQLLANEPAVAEIVWLDLNPAGRRGAHDGIGGFRRLVRSCGLTTSAQSSCCTTATCSPRPPGWLASPTGVATAGAASAGSSTSARSCHRRQAPASAYPGDPVSGGSRHPPALRRTHPDRPRPCARRGMARLGATGSRLRRHRHRQQRDRCGSGAPSDSASLAAALLDAGWPTVVLVGGRRTPIWRPRSSTRMGDRGDRVRLALGWNLADVIGVLSQAEFLCRQQHRGHEHRRGHRRARPMPCSAPRHRSTTPARSSRSPRPTSACMTAWRGSPWTPC